MNIVKVEKAEPWVLDGLNTLLPQLSPAGRQISLRMLEAMVRSRSTTLLAAVEHQRVLGCLALVMFQIPTGLRARIEDLVVGAGVRGKGLGEQLVRQAIGLAEQRGADVVELTSNPQRVAANRLYRKLGFALRETNTYRYVIAGG